MLGNIPIGRTGPAVRWWCTLVGILSPGMNALAQPAVPDQPPEGKAPWQLVLTGDYAKRVAELEKQIGELRRAGKFAEAQKAARAIVELRTRGQGPDHWQTADARRLLHRLAKVAALPEEARRELAEAGKLDAEVFALYQRGHYRDAVPLLKRALAICRRHLGEEDPETLTAINNLALILNASGQSAEAEPLLRTALAI